MTAQNRPAPAFQEYAASMLARLEYRTLTLPQRGLLYSMRLECWVNRFLPESPSVLARILGFDEAEVVAELPYVMPFFGVQEGRIFSPELEDYRSHIDDVRARKSQGGKRGAVVTNSAKKPKRRGVAGMPPGMSSSMPAGMSPGIERHLSTVQSSTAQPRKGVLTGNTVDSIYGEWEDFTIDPEGGE